MTDSRRNRVDVAEEYALSGPLRLTTVGGHGVIRIDHAGGSAVARRAYHSFEPDLYAEVERTLNAAGVRQGRLLRTRTGASSTADGWWLREWVDGEVVSAPQRDTVRAVFDHLARFDEALADVAPPAALIRLDTVFTRVLDVGWLRASLPGLCRSLAPEHRSVVDRAFERLITDDAMSRQVVHGDIGPDNVIMVGSDVASVIDFTPHHRRSITGLAGALYWYCVHPTGTLRPDLLDRAITAYDRRRPLTAVEQQTLPSALVIEALRRVATPLALAQAAGAATAEVDPRRWSALRSLL